MFFGGLMTGGFIMSKKHMTLDDRYTISKMLAENSLSNRLPQPLAKAALLSLVKSVITLNFARPVPMPILLMPVFTAETVLLHCSVDSAIQNALAVLSVTNVILSVLIFWKKNVQNWTSRLTFVTAALPKETALWKNVTIMPDLRMKNIALFFPKAVPASLIQKQSSNIWIRLFLL